jgi:hypothetical protein
VIDHCGAVVFTVRNLQIERGSAGISSQRGSHVRVIGNDQDVNTLAPDVTVVVTLLACLLAVDSPVSGFQAQMRQLIAALRAHEIDGALETTLTHFPISIMLPAISESALWVRVSDPSNRLGGHHDFFQISLVDSVMSSSRSARR